MKTEPRIAVILLILLFLTGHFWPGLRPRTSYGIASWYGAESGEVTASGEIFDPTAQTCATWHYPIGMKLRVTNLLNGRSVICRVNDHGPAWGLGRVVDLTEAAFGIISENSRGLVPVRVEPARARIRA